jgi:hypothetical protein
MSVILADDTALMLLGFRFLRQALFGERTIPMHAEAIEARRGRARERAADAERVAAARMAAEESVECGDAE